MASSLGTAVQHNFRRTLLVPSTEENISSLGAAAQHNLRRALLVLSTMDFKPSVSVLFGQYSLPRRRIVTKLG